MEGYLSIRTDWRKSVACRRRPGIIFPLKSQSICVYVRSWERVERTVGSRENMVSGKRKTAKTKEEAALIAPR